MNRSDAEFICAMVTSAMTMRRRLWVEVEASASRWSRFKGTTKYDLRMQANRETLLRLAAKYRSMRAPVGELPAPRYTADKCDPALAAMARATQDEVFERAVRSLGGG